MRETSEAKMRETTGVVSKTEDLKQDKSSKAGKKKRRFKAKKLVLNVSQTKYGVVRYVAKNTFKMRLSGAPYMADYSNPNDEWDIFWCDGTV